MDPITTNDDFSHLQNVMGSLPMLKRYIVICLCFPLRETVTPSEIETSLQNALTDLACAFPFLTGHVIMEGRQEGTITGNPKIVPLRQNIGLITNNLKDQPKVPSMTDMSQAKYPFSMLDPDVLVPPIAVSWSSEGFEKIAPVLILQANLINGGLLLTFSGNHMTMDMTGLGMIISLFSKACRGECFTEDEIRQGNQSRRDVVPLLGTDYEPGSELEDVYVKPHAIGEKNNPVSSSSSPPRWSYFNFSADSLIRLKQEASKQTIVPYITTDDAVAALCWQTVALARIARKGRQVKTQFARPISARKYLGLQGYLGHMVDCVYENEIDAWNRPLGEIAGRLRRLLLQDEKISFHVRAFATVLDRSPDKSQLVNGATLDLDRDVILSSYANIRCCQLSFGQLLGKPQAARRPRMPVAPSLLYMMPKSQDGDIAVAFCLREDDMARLRRDDVFTSYAEYIE